MFGIVPERKIVMKKIISLILVFIMLVSVASCAGDPVNNDDTTDNVQDTVVESTEDSDTATETVNPNKIPAEKYNGVFKAGETSSTGLSYILRACKDPKDSPITKSGLYSSSQPEIC